MATSAARRIKTLAIAFTHAVGRSQARMLTGDERMVVFEVAEAGLLDLFDRLDKKAAELIAGDEPKSKAKPKSKPKSKVKSKAKRANSKDDAPATAEG